VLEVHGGEVWAQQRLHHDSPAHVPVPRACGREPLRTPLLLRSETCFSGIFSACIRCPGGPRRADEEMVVQRAQCFECDKEPASAPSVHRGVAARRDCALAPTDSVVSQVKNRAPRGCVSKHCSCTLIICTSQAGIGAFRGVCE
jgi:hypothetical protein